MKNINNLNPQSAIIFRDGNEELILVLNETNVEVITDGTDFDKILKGTITFINEDGLRIEDGDIMFWEYIEEIKIIQL